MFSDSPRNLIRNCFVISGFMGLIPVFENCHWKRTMKMQYRQIVCPMIARLVAAGSFCGYIYIYI